MEYEPLLRWLHVIGAAVLFGTGAGIAFFMVMARRSGNVQSIATIAAITVRADFLFTATAVAAQPVTGLLLAQVTGWRLSEGWIVVSLALYVVTGLFWLPVVWIQIQLRDMAAEAVASHSALPARFDRLYRIWFAAGFPAFISVLAIYWLMLTRPAIGLP